MRLSLRMAETPAAVNSTCFLTQGNRANGWRWAMSWCWPGPRSRGRRRHDSRQRKRINLIIIGEVNASAGSDAGIEAPRAGQQFVRPAAGINNIARIAVKAVQPLISVYICANYPDNNVIGAVSRGSEGSSSTRLGRTPDVYDGRWIGCGDAESGDRRATSAEGDIGALLGSIGYCRLDDVTVGNLSRGYGCTDAAQVVAIKQIRIAILSQGNH